MNAEYIKKRLIGQAVPKEIAEDALYFMMNYGWRKGPMENIYILGVDRGRYDYYWICFTEKKEIKFMSCCCKIDREIIANTERELSEYDRKLIVEKITDLVIKGKRQLLICMFTVDEDLEYDSKVETLEKEITLMPHTPEEGEKADPELSHEIEALADGKTWTKENLKDSMKEELIEYAIGKLNETRPLTIKLSQLETLRYNAFQEKHRKCVSGKMGAIGGGILLKVTGTGLGWCFDCICNGCGAAEDITDTSQW